MSNWTPILEMDDETTGEHTCYWRETGKQNYPFLWITQFPDGWHVETKRHLNDEIITLKICKSLKSAKRWVTIQSRCTDFK